MGIVGRMSYGFWWILVGVRWVVGWCLGGRIGVVWCLGR